MINIQVNKKVIAKMHPCKDRFDNYLANYSSFNGSILEFLDLDKISSIDKIWVTLRLLPQEQLEYFAIDCAFAAYAAYAAAYATYATAYATANAAAYAVNAADAAAYAAARTAPTATYKKYQDKLLEMINDLSELERIMIKKY